MSEPLQAEQGRHAKAPPPVKLEELRAGDSVLLAFEVVNTFPDKGVVTVRRAGTPKLGQTASSPQLGPLRFGILVTDVVRRIPMGQPLPTPPWPPLEPRDE